jgi:hypothetical protein
LNQPIRFAILCGVLCVSLACTTAGVINPAQSAEKDNGVLFEDRFSDPASGWTTWEQDVSAVGYQDGGLMIRVNEAGFDYWSRPGKRYSDTRNEVEAIKVEGPDDNDFGLICRYRNGDNFYAFLISSDGYYGIALVRDGEYTALGSDGMQFSDAIRQGNATNRLRGDCVGSTLTLYVNSSKLAEVEDKTFRSGEVGLIVGTYQSPGTAIQFDNFIVSKP